jgi:broad specificity phosphatase PhoE
VTPALIRSLAFVTIVAAIVSALLISGTAAAARVPLVEQLRSGGLVFVMRHAATDFSQTDRQPLDFADCTSQRNLNAQGRRDARAIGTAIRRLRIRIGAVLASPYCRTRETARLAFGRVTASHTLRAAFVEESAAAARRRLEAFRELASRRPANGTVTVLVTHQVVVEDATGLDLAEGETAIFKPRGKGMLQLVTRVSPQDWQNIVRLTRP